MSSLTEEAVAQIGSFEIIIQSVKTEGTQHTKSREPHHLDQPEAFEKPPGGSSAKRVITNNTLIVISGSRLGTFCRLVDVYNDWRHFLLLRLGKATDI